MRLIVTIAIECGAMTANELEFAGWEDDEGMGDPTPMDYTAEDVADLLPGVLTNEEVVAEMFAGSAIFMNVTGADVLNARWADA